MAAEVHESTREIPMSWEDYRALDEDRGEYVDGKLLVTPRGTWAHQTALRRLANLLEQQGHVAVTEWAWRPSGPLEYQPDVMVLQQPPPGTVNWTDQTPLLCVEVTSPSNASKDWVRNLRQYAQHGVPHYWIVSPGEGSLVTFALGGADGPRQYEQSGVFTGHVDTIASWPGLVFDVRDLLH